MDTLFDIVEETQLMGTPVMDTEAITQLLIRFFFNFVIVGIIIHFFYYPKSRRRDYYFTFSLINVSVFFLIILMGSVKLKIGFALGIFAIFGIIRYRTESVPIREMTYRPIRYQCLVCTDQLCRTDCDKLYLYPCHLAAGKRTLAETCILQTDPV